MDNQLLLKSRNPLLLKDQDGKAKPTTYDLLPPQHSYGKKVIDDPEPIKYVVNGWQTAKQSSGKPSNQKDFKELNKRAISNNVHTAQGQTKLRSTMDILIKTIEGKKVMPILLPEEGFTYGVQNRPSTPVKLVIGNCYAIQQANRKEQIYRQSIDKTMKTQNTKLQPFKTKSQALRQQKVKKEKEYRGKPNIDPKFKMEKFTKSNATKVDTNLKAINSTVKSKQADQQNKSSVVEKKQ